MAYTTIDDPSAHFHIQLYTGNGSSDHQITNNANAGDFKPDWLWVKPRSESDNPVHFDSSRGSDRQLKSNGTDAEDTHSPARFTFLTDGFEIDSNDRNYNQSSATYVAWQWIANGGTTTSFSASGAQLAGTRQSNTTAGFSIITYTGDGNNNATIPHGLNSAPKYVIIKDRGNATNWYVGHNSTFTTGEIFFNLTNAVAAAFGPFNKTAPTASNIVLGTDGNVNGSGDTMICYAFAEVQGYSKFGSYTGNGNADGPFVYTGFKPAYVVIKRTDSTGNWWIYDTIRNGASGSNTNPAHKILYTNDSSGEVDNSSRGVDLVSNGFKLRHTLGNTNADGGTYIYMCFASHPFVSSEGVPTTAR